MEDLQSIRELVVEVLGQTKGLGGIDSVGEADEAEFWLRLAWTSIYIDCVGLLRFLNHALDDSPEFNFRLTNALSQFEARAKLARVSEIIVTTTDSNILPELELWHKEFSEWIQPLLEDRTLMKSLKVHTFDGDR